MKGGYWQLYKPRKWNLPRDGTYKSYNRACRIVCSQSAKSTCAESWRVINEDNHIVAWFTRSKGNVLEIPLDL